MDVHSSRRGTPYCYLTLVTSPGVNEVIHVWGDLSSIKVGGLITLSEVMEGRGQVSVSATSISVTTGEEVSVDAYLPEPPARKAWDDVADTIGGFIEDDDLRSVFVDIARNLYEPYSCHTAAKSNHHAYKGGLAQHTYEMMRMFAHLYVALPFKVNPFIVGISLLFHDYGKMNEYDADLNLKPAYFLQGHPFLGAEAVGVFLRRFDFIPDELIQHCQHCVLAHHGRLEYGSPVLPASPEAFLVSQLDELSGHGVMYDKPSGTRAFGTTIQRFGENL